MKAFTVLAHDNGGFVVSGPHVSDGDRPCFPPTPVPSVAVSTIAEVSEVIDRLTMNSVLVNPTISRDDGVTIPRDDGYCEMSGAKLGPKADAGAARPAGPGGLHRYEGPLPKYVVFKRVGDGRLIQADPYDCFVLKRRDIYADAALKAYADGVADHGHCPLSNDVYRLRAEWRRRTEYLGDAKVPD